MPKQQVPKELRVRWYDSNETAASKRFWQLVVKIEKEKHA